MVHYLLKRQHALSKQLKNQEIGIAHLALALESLNPMHQEVEEAHSTKTAVKIASLAGAGLGAIWGPVGVLAGAGVGAGIGELAPDALQKAKEGISKLRADLKIGSKESETKRLRFNRLNPFKRK